MNTQERADEFVQVEILAISIYDGHRATFTAAGRMHGLGVVGEPLLPYLDHRAEGYLLTLPPDIRNLRVWERDWTRAPLKSGKQPKRYIPISALGAPDVQLPAVDGEAK